MDEVKYIDAAPPIREYDKSLQWLSEHAAELSMREVMEQGAAFSTARQQLIDAPAADVRPVVLCRECGSWHDGVCDTHSFSNEVPPDFFCANGWKDGADVRGEAAGK